MRIGDSKLHARSPRLVSLRRNSVQIASASEHLASAVGVDAHRDDDRDRDDASAASDLQVSAIDPEIRPFSLDGPVKRGLYLVVDFLAEPGHLALGDAVMPMALTRSSTERVETPWI